MKTNFNIQKVLVAPLDWGLGHATRCIPIIKALLANDYTVVLAAEGKQQILLEKEFPKLQIIPLKGYNISYAKSKYLLPFKMLAQVFKILNAIQYEHNWLHKIIEEHYIDLVISDNRYGLYSSKVPCVFITHQLTIKLPFHWLEMRLQAINCHFINRFTACWVPDVKGENNIAGVLSHPRKMPKIPVHYLGILSRFDKMTPLEKKYDYCILLSGPEPQRTLLEDKILSNLTQTTSSILLVRGKPGSSETLTVPANMEVQNHLTGSDILKAILQSEYIISRSGYTTVMELITLQKKSILIPTPGQTEQEYLANRLMKQGWGFSIQQQDVDFVNVIALAKKFTYSFPMFNSVDLKILIPQLVEDLQS